MKEVYCENCKYVWWDDRSPYMCSNGYAREEINGGIPYCLDLNKHNDCPHYKRKWWKVWVR